MAFVLGVRISQRHSRLKRVRKVEKGDYWLRHVCLSGRMEQVG